MMMNKVSAIKGILSCTCAVVVFLFLIVYSVITQNTIIPLPGLILLLCGSLAGILIMLCIADLEIENEKLKVIYFLRVKEINLNELIFNDMRESMQGMFYLFTNIGFLMVSFNYKNYQVIKQVILRCKKSKVTLEQLKILGKEGSFLRSVSR